MWRFHYRAAAAGMAVLTLFPFALADPLQASAELGSGATVPSLPVGQDVPQPGIRLLIERVQQRYQKVSDLEARFVQRRLSRFGAVVVENRGQVFMSLPGKMRWEYEEPEQLFVTAGEEMYFYLPEDNQVQVFPAEEARVSRTPVMFLAGKGDLLRDFDIEETDWGSRLSPGNVQVRLLPRHHGASFTSLVLEIEPMNATIARLVKFDLLSNTIDYQFDEIHFDVGLAEGLFEFEIPPDAAVMYVES